MSVLDAGYAASAIAVFSVVVSWISHICCNDSRYCHAKEVLLKLVIKVLLECMCLFSTSTYSS